MAELSYDDVRRAAQSAASDLQTAVNDIRTNVQNTRNDIMRINPSDFQVRMLNLQRSLDQLMQYMQRLEVCLQNSQNINAALQQTQQLILRVEQRLVNTEHIAAETTRYIEVMHEQMVQLTDLHAQNLMKRAEP